MKVTRDALEALKDWIISHISSIRNVRFEHEGLAIPVRNISSPWIQVGELEELVLIAKALEVDIDEVILGHTKYENQDNTRFEIIYESISIVDVEYGRVLRDAFVDMYNAIEIVEEVE